MSEFRRKLLFSKKSSTDGWVEIAKITKVGTTKVNLPRKYREIGFFVVGGGGSGRGDFYMARSSGNGGNGGCVNSFIVPFGGDYCSVTVGSGGEKAASQSDSNNGYNSSVLYNGVTYRSNGGYGGSNITYTSCVNTKQENSGIGGWAIWGGEYNNQTMYQWCATHIASEQYPGKKNVYGGKGEDGLPNPFDESDTNLYGAGGGASQNAYDISHFWPAISGGINGGGAGGYGIDNAKTNTGKDGSFYGAGGGGGSFSSNHYNSIGGAGYQGIVIIYGKSDY